MNPATGHARPVPGPAQANPLPPNPRLPVLLVGFMGAGKSTVGPILARALGCGFVDLDAAVERRLGRPVPAIVRDRGLSFFRRAESETAARILVGPPVVLATGGGWAARPGRVDALARRARCVWLRVRPRTVLARIGDGLRDRPLLDVPDPLAAARVLLDERTPFYARCGIRIDTDELAPGQVAAEILRRLDISACAQPRPDPGSRPPTAPLSATSEGDASP